MEIIYSKRNTEHWDRFFNLLVEANKVWAKNAAALVVVIARPARFDAGAAWENLALEANVTIFYGRKSGVWPTKDGRLLDAICKCGTLWDICF